MGISDYKQTHLRLRLYMPYIAQTEKYLKQLQVVCTQSISTLEVTEKVLPG